MLQLSKIEDPYFYFDRLTMPKLIVNAVGDEFQQPDDTSLWWADLPEPKHFLMVPNAEHSMATGILEVVPAIGSWLHAHFTETSIPKVTWDIAREGEGDISVAVALSGGYKIASVRKMYGETCNGERRDFRFLTNDSPCTCGVEVSGQCFNAKSFWKGEDIAAEEDDGANSKYLATYDAPADGKWAAFFVEVRLVKEDVEEAEEMEGSIVGRRDRDPFIPRSKPGELVFTSEVSIVPNIFPFDDCHMETCKGTLV
jgi:hypothetical protein